MLMLSRKWTSVSPWYKYSVTDDVGNKGTATRTIDVVTRTETVIKVPGLPTALFAATNGRGLHSSTFQLNLSRF